MNKRYTHGIASAALITLPGMGLAHHGPADDIGGQLAHATFDPAHLGVTLLVAGILFAGYRVVAWLRGRS